MLTGVITLADGEAINLQADELAERLTIISGALATTTVSRVNNMNASAHTTGAQNQSTVAADTKLTIDVDWPFYRVSVAGGPCRVAFV